MRNLDPLWLMLAGFGGGLAGSVAGLASLVSYPALLAIGLPPVVANVSNTVALVFMSAGSVAGSRPELGGQRTRAKKFGAIAIAGGITGAVLLLAPPSRSFVLVVPWLIGLASLAIVLRRSPPDAVPASPRKPFWTIGLGVFVVAVYGGYFGAAGGVVLLALLIASSNQSFAQSNALKNLLAGLINGVAALAFMAFASVRWSVVVPLACGFLVGGRLGPILVRRAPPGPLRTLIACVGLGVAVHLGLNAYGG